MSEKKKIKYKTKITISLESFNFAKMQQIAYGYYNTSIPKNVNDPSPEKIDDYVWINSSQSQTEEEEDVIPKEIKDEVKHLQKTKIPRCPICKKNYVNAIDSITKKKSKYLWKPNCEHNPNARMSIG